MQLQVMLAVLLMLLMALLMTLLMMQLMVVLTLVLLVTLLLLMMMMMWLQHGQWRALATGGGRGRRNKELQLLISLSQFRQFDFLEVSLLLLELCDPTLQLKHLLIRTVLLRLQRQCAAAALRTPLPLRAPPLLLLPVLLLLLPAFVRNSSGGSSACR